MRAEKRKEDNPWTAAEMMTLRELWGTVSAPQIAEMLGRSTNSIIGKAHRMGLPPINWRTRAGWSRAGFKMSRAKLNSPKEPPWKA